VDGFLRGADCIVRRNMLIEALRVPSCDGSPGIIDLPFWGRFPVVVGDGCEVSESSDQQGQCGISVPFVRAGVGAESRTPETVERDIGAVAERVRSAAVREFEERLDPALPDVGTPRAGPGRISNSMLAVVGRIRGVPRVLNTVTAAVLGILRLANRGVLLPRDISPATFNAAASIVAGIVGTRNGPTGYGREMGGPFSAPPGPSLPAPDNERNALLLLLSADSFELPGGAATAGRAATGDAVENLYKTAAYAASAGIVAGIDPPTRENAAGYRRLPERLPESVGRENPEVRAALCDLRSALSRRLSAQRLSSELTRRVSVPVPLPYLAHRPGCDGDSPRRLNRAADSFMLEGDVVYV